MTARKDNLTTLRDAVAAGETENNIGLVWETFGDTLVCLFFANACRGQSVDVSLQFMKAVLPSWYWKYDSGKCMATVRSRHGSHAHCSQNESPATALILATLDALIAKEGTE